MRLRTIIIHTNLFSQGLRSGAAAQIVHSTAAERRLLDYLLLSVCMALAPSQYVLALFGPESRRRARTSHSAVRASRAAARSGHLACLQVLLAAGCLHGSTDQAVAAAATAEAEAKAATAEALRRGGGNGGSGSGSGSGGPMDGAHDVLAAAASSGRLEVLEWVAAAQGVEEDEVAPPATSTAAGGLAAAQVAAAAAPAAEAAAAAGERPQRRRRSYLLLADVAEEAVAGSGRHGAATGEARAMLTWLRSRGCAWGPAVMSRAISCGDRELVGVGGGGSGCIACIG